MLQGLRDLGCEALKDDRPLIFYHVPKTGGGTVRGMLLNLDKLGMINMCQQCAKLPQGEKHSCMETDVNSLRSSCGHIYADDNPLVQKPPYDVIAGHYNLDVERIWTPEPPRSAPESERRVAWRIIQFRDPVQRMRSLWNFQTVNEVVHTSFEEFILGYDEYNRDALWEKFRGEREAYRGLTIAVIRACGQTCIGRLSGGNLTAAGALQLAKANLEREFEVVGITEEMDMFVEMCRRRFHRLRDMGKTPLDVGESLHVTDKEFREASEAVLDKPEVRKALTRSMALRHERELYLHAKAVMAAQWTKLGSCKVNKQA